MINFKSKPFWLGVVIVVAVVVGLSEYSKSVERSEALNELNSSYTSLKTNAGKVAAVVKADIKIRENRSLFSLFNSWAFQRGLDRRYDIQSGFDDGEGEGGGLSGSVETSEVTTVEIWYNPEAGEWQLIQSCC